MKQFVLIVASLTSLFALADVDKDKLANSLSRIEHNRSKKGPYQVQVLDHTFWAHHNVFSPEFFTSTAIQNRLFPFQKNETFLDMGSGIGVTSVIAAKIHNNKVVALDINPDAVEMTRQNAELHGLASQIDCRQSDVFSALKANETFNTMYWDLPYVRSDEDANLDLLQRAVSDPGYTHIKKFIADARKHLKPNGRIIIGFGTLGDMPYLIQIAKENKFEVVELTSEKHPYRGGIAYSLLKLSPIVETTHGQGLNQEEL